MLAGKAYVMGSKHEYFPSSGMPKELGHCYKNKCSYVHINIYIT